MRKNHKKMPFKKIVLSDLLSSIPIWAWAIVGSGVATVVALVVICIICNRRYRIRRAVDDLRVGTPRELDGDFALFYNCVRWYQQNKNEFEQEMQEKLDKMVERGFVQGTAEKVAFVEAIKPYYKPKVENLGVV